MSDAEFDLDEFRALPWVADLLAKYRGGIAHTFMVHGNIDDYPTRADTTLVASLTQMFTASANGRRPREVVVRYSIDRGITFPDDGNETKRQMSDAFYRAAGLTATKVEERHHDPLRDLLAIDRALLFPPLRSKIALIVEYPEMIWPDAELGSMSDRDRLALSMLRRWASDHEYTAAEQVLVLIAGAPTDMHSTLRTASSIVEQVEVPYPDATDRQAFIEGRVAAMNAGSRHLRLAEGLTTRTFASLTGGLTRRMIEDICLRSVESGHPVDSPLITERKDEIVKAEFGDLIEIVEPRHGFDDVGGLVEVKRYLMRSVVGPLRDPTRRGRMPSGMLFAGPPGTGKTYVIVALAYEAGVPMVKLNAGRLLGHYHGTSERNLEKALKCIRALRPCLVLVDEIDQQFQRGDSGDSGVERRLFGRLLEEMSGSGEGQRGDTVWFAATNRVDKVDPALLRRFGKIVPILPPGRGERGEILCAKLRVPAAQWATTIAGAQLDGLLDRTDGFTGAEIDNLIVKAIELADDDGRETSTIADVTKALGLLRMPSSADREHMLRVALEMCNDLELIPAEWRDEVRQIDEQRAAA